MTEREKIIETLKRCENEWHEEEFDLMARAHFSYIDNIKLADALIAAGFGDVTEWKEKVECAKRILQIPTLPDGKTDLSYFEYKGERIQDIARQRDEYKHRAEVAFRALLICIKDSRPAHCSITGCSKWTRCGDDACVETRKAMFIEQAEKELAEERKDG